MTNKIKGSKAITLIALIITIIVLLILAGVVINMTLGNNGIITKAQGAADRYKNAQNNEQEIMNNLYNYINDIYQVGNTRSVDANLKADVLEMVYPVGSIYIGTTNTNPSTFIGGTWKIYGEGRTIIGAGKGKDSNSEERIFNVNDTGGEYMHQLSIQEMPNHTHNLTLYEREVYKGGGGSDAIIGWQPTGDYTTYTVPSVGGDQSHNNIQPYIVTYMWKRVS